MKVLAYDIRHNPKVEALGVPYMDIDEILPQADIVSVHVPLMPSTYHFIDKDKWVSSSKVLPPHILARAELCTHVM